MGDNLAITEFSFSVDDFQDPKMYKDPEAISVLLTRLLLLEPGLLQSHPDAGVGLYSRYAYSVEGTAAELEVEFQKQIEKYLPRFQGVRVSVTEKDGMFNIAVEIDGTLYGIYYDSSKSTVVSNYAKITNL